MAGGRYISRAAAKAEGGAALQLAVSCSAAISPNAMRYPLLLILPPCLETQQPVITVASTVQHNTSCTGTNSLPATPCRELSQPRCRCPAGWLHFQQQHSSALPLASGRPLLLDWLSHWLVIYGIQASHASTTNEAGAYPCKARPRSIAAALSVSATSSSMSVPARFSS